MPTDKERREILLTVEEERYLLGLWKELRCVPRRGRMEYIGLKLSFNEWLKKILLDGAAQVEQHLGEQDEGV